MIASRLGFALLATSALLGGTARANSCHAEHATCSTSMPAGGYCECFQHGEALSGTVMGPEGHYHHHTHHVPAS